MFTKIGNGCYTVAERKVGLAYTNAISLCRDMNASLASLETLAELNSLQEYLTNLYRKRLRSTLFALSTKEVIFISARAWKWVFGKNE